MALAESGFLSAAEARARVAALDPDRLATIELEGAAGAQPLGRGVGASIGVASGTAVFDPLAPSNAPAAARR